jgi:hypothetical protein
MKTLSARELDEVSAGAGFAQTVSTTGTVVGAGAIGSYLSAARFGASLGAAAGPLGAVAGAMIGAGGVYLYYHYAVAMH